MNIPVPITKEVTPDKNKIPTVFVIEPKKLTESYLVSNQKIKKALGIEKMPVTAEEGLTKTFESFSVFQRLNSIFVFLFLDLLPLLMSIENYK